jgi:hypothetical protein
MALPGVYIRFIRSREKEGLTPPAAACPDAIGQNAGHLKNTTCSGSTRLRVAFPSISGVSPTGSGWSRIFEVGTSSSQCSTGSSGHWPWHNRLTRYLQATLAGIEMGGSEGGAIYLPDPEHRTATLRQHLNTPESSLLPTPGAQSGYATALHCVS